MPNLVFSYDDCGAGTCCLALGPLGYRCCAMNYCETCPTGQFSVVGSFCGKNGAHPCNPCPAGT